MSQYVFKGTPGPWEIVRIGDCRISISAEHILSKDVPPIDLWHSLSHTFPVNKQEGLANAHLIAAAPDLLASAIYMLQVARCNSDSEKVAYNELKASIHKALNIKP